MAKKRVSRMRIREVSDFDVVITNTLSGEITLTFSRYDDGLVQRVSVQLDRLTVGRVGRELLRMTRGWAKAAVAEAELNP